MKSFSNNTQMSIALVLSELVAFYTQVRNFVYMILFLGFFISHFLACCQHGKLI